MFRITVDPSSGSLVQCLAKNYKKYSIVSVDMDKVGVMAEYSDPLCVRVCVCVRARARARVQFTVYEGTAEITPTLSMSTDTIEPFL